MPVRQAAQDRRADQLGSRIGRRQQAHNGGTGSKFVGIVGKQRQDQAKPKHVNEDDDKHTEQTTSLHHTPLESFPQAGDSAPPGGTGMMADRVRGRLATSGTPLYHTMAGPIWQSRLTHPFPVCSVPFRLFVPPWLDGRTQRPPVPHDPRTPRGREQGSILFPTWGGYAHWDSDTVRQWHTSTVDQADWLTWDRYARPWAWRSDLCARSAAVVYSSRDPETWEGRC